MSKLLGVEKGFQVDGLVSALNASRERSHLNSVIRDYNALRDQYDALLVSRNINKAAEAALAAQYELLKSQAPDAPCLKQVSERFKNGDPKSVGRLLYEEVYRREARKLGVPESNIKRFLDV